MELGDFINFENLITNYDESELIKESIVFASDHQYTDEKVPKKYFDPFIEFINGSSLLQYNKIEDIYFKPCVDDYENIYNEKYENNVKKISNAPQLCTFLNDYNSKSSDSDNAKSSDSNDAKSSDSNDAESDNAESDNADSNDTKSDDSYDSDNQKSESNTNLIKNLFFESDDGSTIIFYIDFEISNKNLQMFGIVNFEDKIYAFCGTSAAHPFVITNNFSYDNSDSECPNISNKLASVKTTDKIFPHFIKYFKKFCNDSYH
jgi:hypothetical protein